MRIALLQINPKVCDLRANTEKIVSAAEKAFANGADICVTPELAVIGYTPRDLLLRPGIIGSCLDAVKWVCTKTADLGPVLVGTPFFSGKDQKILYNGACLLIKGEIARFFGKTLLPNYDVFDEQRYFSSFNEPGFFSIQDKRIGVTICEDIWNDQDFRQQKKYGADPVQNLVGLGVDLIINMSASPFSLGKQNVRKTMLVSLAQKHNIPFLLCNQVGGNDELFFAGRSLAVNEHGEVMAAAKEFEEDILVVDTDNQENNVVRVHDCSPESEAWNALVIGLRDYMVKSGFSSALLGLSGGIDSALVSALAVQAAGPENVTGIIMPSPYSSRGSIEDSLELAANLGMKTMTIPIDKLMNSYDSALAQIFAGTAQDVTEENIQSRIRGNLLMAVSNKLGGLVLATGNKSELAVGYCTIYGDMCGGLAPIADVPKTMVYALARWLNSKGTAIIPRQIITKPPSAELSPHQRDQDILPDYEILDQILHLLIQCKLSQEEIRAQGFDPHIVRSVASMVKKAEFKRFQSPPGIKITDMAFGTGWRMPLAASCSIVTKM